MAICPTCGLPHDLCVCETIAKQDQLVTVKLVKKKFGKKHTYVEGITGMDIKVLSKKLKNKFACGGTAKDNIIDLHGDHFKTILSELVKEGFKAESIVFKDETRRK